MNKAQIQSQVFIYILTAVIIGLTILFGYKALSGTQKMASEAELVKFKSDIANDIKALDYGRTVEYYVNVPLGYEVCFVSGDVYDIHLSDKTMENFLKNAYSSTGKNLFLINKKTKSVTTIETNSLTIKGPRDSSLLCFDSPTKILLDNIGKTVEVSKI